MREGILIPDMQSGRADIRFNSDDCYGGLHCGTTMDVWLDDQWIPTRRIRPNGLPIENGSPLLAVEHIFPGLAVSLLLAFITFWSSSKLLGSGGKSDG